MNEGLNFMETLLLLDALDVEMVSVKGLIKAFYQEEKPVSKEKELPALPAAPTPVSKPKVYASYSDAKAKCAKGESPVFDKELEGFVNEA